MANAPSSKATLWDAPYQPTRQERTPHVLQYRWTPIPFPPHVALQMTLRQAL